MGHDFMTMFTETQNQFTELKDSVLRELHQLKAENDILTKAVIRLQTEKDELTNIKTPNPDMFYIGLLVVGVVGFVVGMLGVVYNITM